MKTELNSFFYAFQISRKIIFEVYYYRCGNNTNNYFSTSASQFNQPKTDYNRCGQAQNELLNNNTMARIIFNKWDCLHLQDLNKEQYNRLKKDIEILKSQYNFIMDENNLSFNEIRELSKAKVKK